MPINHHSGSAAPDYGDYPEAKVMFLLEVTWWAHRTLWQLIFAGVMERHPRLRFVFTEQGTAWLPERLATLDYYQARMSAPTGSQEAIFGAEVMKNLSLKPSEYWARQCYVGASFIRPSEVALRDQVGVDRIMWGNDFPHREGCWPYSHEHLRLSFAGVDPVEVQQMVGGNAAEVYGFDLDAAGTGRRRGRSPRSTRSPAPSMCSPTCPTTRCAVRSSPPNAAPPRPPRRKPRRTP